MARSQYIYVVQREDGGLVAAFTVKHELLSWLTSEPSPWLEDGDDDEKIYVTRMRDAWAGSRTPVPLDPNTLQPAL
jgi:hypothetical protein